MGVGDYFTKRLLKDGGITFGMRVLDIGCGAGDVSMMVAELVGATGMVVGIDRDNTAIGIAKQRAGAVSTVSFYECDVGEIPKELSCFDAIVGRRVLIYQKDVIAVLKNLNTVLKPNGIMVFQEHDATMCPMSVLNMPLHAKVQSWMTDTIIAEGANTRIGFDLRSALIAAGFEVTHVRAEALVQTPEQPYAAGAIVKAIMPRIIAQGVATAEEIDIETLQARLDEERRNTECVYIADMMFGFCSRKAARS